MQKEVAIERDHWISTNVHAVKRDKSCPQLIMAMSVDSGGCHRGSSQHNISLSLSQLGEGYEEGGDEAMADVHDCRGRRMMVML